MLDFELDVSMEDCNEFIGGIEMPARLIEVGGGSPTIESSCACSYPSACGSCGCTGKPPYC